MKPNLHFIQVISWVHEVVGGLQPQLFPRAIKTYEDGETPFAMCCHAKLRLDLCDTEGRRVELVFSGILSYREVVSPRRSPPHIYVARMLAYKTGLSQNIPCVLKGWDCNSCKL